MAIEGTTATSTTTLNSFSVLLILFICFLYIGWKLYISSIRKKFVNPKTGKGIPGPEPVFLLGHLHWLFWYGGFFPTFERLSSYGAVSLFFVGPFPWIYANSMEAFQRILKNNRVWQRGNFFSALRYIFGDALFVLEGEEWRRHRHLMNPFFNKESIREFFPLIQEVAMKHIEKTRRNVCQETDMRLCANGLTTQVISNYAFGVYVEEAEEIIKDVDKLGKELSNFTALKILGVPSSFPYMKNVLEHYHKHFDYLYNKMKGVEASDNVWGRLRTFKGENGESLSENELKSECIALLAAGTDTTSASLLFLMKMIKEHPEVRKKLLREIKETIGSNIPTFDQLHSLKYLENVVLESLRMHGLSTSTNRISIQDDEVCGYSIPAGTTAWISPYLVVARNLPYWKDHFLFNPDRFEGLDETSPEKKSVYFAFGYGPHVCLGQQLAMVELKLMATLLLQHFTWEFSPKSDWRPKNPNVTLSPKCVIGAFFPVYER